MGWVPWKEPALLPLAVLPSCAAPAPALHFLGSQFLGKPLRPSSPTSEIDMGKAAGRKKPTHVRSELGERLAKFTLDQKFWDRPSRLTEGDETADTIFLAVGKALTAWETSEMMFALLFSVLIETKTPAASRVYGGLVSATAKRDALQSAGEIFFKQPKMPSELGVFFADLLKNYQAAASLRNDIAHGMTLQTNTEAHGCTGFFLIPTPTNSRKVIFDPSSFLPASQATSESLVAEWTKSHANGFVKRSRYVYTSKQVAQIGLKFNALMYPVVILIALIPPEFRKHLAHSYYVRPPIQ
jgi:hypothetical protein